MTTIRAAAELDHHDGEVVVVIGRYAVISTGRHKILYARPDGSTGATDQLAQLGLDGGGVVALGVRPDAEHATLAGKLVRATGRLVARPTRRGRGAQPDPRPTLVQITAVVEAP